MTKKKAIVFDMDGVIANIDHRLMFVQPPPITPGYEFNFRPDWDAFFEDDQIMQDEVIVPTKELINGLLNTRTHVVIMTARPQKTRVATEKWLAEWCVGYDALYMRPDGDHALHSAAQWKQHKMAHLLDDYDVIGFYDDSEANVSAIQELGITSMLYTVGPEPRRKGRN